MLSDVRVGAAVTLLWSVLVIALAAVLGLFKTAFFHFGPSPSVLVFDYPIDSWSRWSAIVVYIVLNQLITTYDLNTISPWQLNQVQNPQVRSLPQSRQAVLGIFSVWYLFLWLGRVISVQLLLSQIDFLLVILVVDLTITLAITDRFYLQHKRLAQVDLPLLN